MASINLKKEQLTQNYIAKQKLPGGILKDDVIVYDIKKKIYTHQKTGVIVPFNCAEETAFFKLEEKPLFEVGELVHITKTNTFTKTPDSQMGKSRFVEIKDTTELKVVSSSLGTCVVELVEQPGVKVSLNDKLLLRSIYWYFYNTDGKLQQALVGKLPEKEAWMKMIDQYFTSKSQAETWKVTRFNYNKKS